MLALSTREQREDIRRQKGPPCEEVCTQSIKRRAGRSWSQSPKQGLGKWVIGGAGVQPVGPQRFWKQLKSLVLWAPFCSGTWKHQPPLCHCRWGELCFWIIPDNGVRELWSKCSAFHPRTPTVHLSATSLQVAEAGARLLSITDSRYDSDSHPPRHCHIHKDINAYIWKSWILSVIYLIQLCQDAKVLKLHFFLHFFTIPFQKRYSPINVLKLLSSPDMLIKSKCWWILEITRQGFFKR